ncbi:MAG: hypothetical protein P1U85_10730 [Verrucomicrobiales bacterium]|nr:hypothetical protein [Verrucomicrobiales bacterium]
MKFPTVRILFLLTPLSLLLSGCNSDLEERVDRLEAELRGVRSDTRDEVSELKNRVISAETTIGISSDGRSFEDRIGQLEASVSEYASMRQGNNGMVYLRPNLRGHAPLNTDHGTFLVRMEGMDLNIETGGYNVHLNIGNPHAIAIEQFTLVGDHGGGTPQLAEGEAYSLDNPKIRKWQESLKPFEYRVTKTLEPFSWTPFDIELTADSREELEMIRFSLRVENARLKRQTAIGGSENPYAHISIDSQAASVLRTEYGAFLITVKGAEKTDLGTRLDLEIGNPYGFTINECRLVGEYGPAIPQRADSTTPEEFSEQMGTWSASLQPFESMVSSKVSNFRWNAASVLIPGPIENVQFLRCQLRVEDVTLPAATDKSR